MKVSIAITIHEYGGKGSEILELSFTKILNQTFKDFEVVVSDDSNDDTIKLICDKWKSLFDIKYFKNELQRRSGADNRNNSIQKCSGDIIKILDGDDLLFDNNSLELIVKEFDDNTKWLFSSYVHSTDRINFYNYHIPIVNENIAICNTLGTPSGMTISNKIRIPLFDKKLRWCFDCEFYYRMIKIYGLPKILDKPTMINFIWDKSGTTIRTQENVLSDNKYIIDKIAGFI